jgi:hypothetical protein
VVLNYFQPVIKTHKINKVSEVLDELFYAKQNITGFLRNQVDPKKCMGNVRSHDFFTSKANCEDLKDVTSPAIIPRN